MKVKLSKLISQKKYGPEFHSPNRLPNQSRLLKYNIQSVGLQCYLFSQKGIGTYFLFKIVSVCILLYLPKNWIIFSKSTINLFDNSIV